jgi:hypothetical protein
MLETILAGLGGLIIGAGLVFAACFDPTGDAAAVARLTRELDEAHERHLDQQRELWAVLAECHLQLLRVDRRVRPEGTRN